MAEPTKSLSARAFAITKLVPDCVVFRVEPKSQGEVHIHLGNHPVKLFCRILNNPKFRKDGEVPRSLKRTELLIPPEWKADLPFESCLPPTVDPNNYRSTMEI